MEKDIFPKTRASATNVFSVKSFVIALIKREAIDVESLPSQFGKRQQGNQRARPRKSLSS